MTLCIAIQGSQGCQKIMQTYWLLSVTELQWVNSSHRKIFCIILDYSYIVQYESNFHVPSPFPTRFHIIFPNSWLSWDTLSFSIAKSASLSGIHNAIFQFRSSIVNLLYGNAKLKQTSNVETFNKGFSLLNLNWHCSK